jgi:glutamine synthetase
VQNVAHSYGKTATFMPKPLVGDNGSGMHVHQSLAKGGKNLFTGDGYGGPLATALYYIGGIMKHAHAINAFTNASTNSYKRLVKGLRGADAARLLGAQPVGVDPRSRTCRTRRAAGSKFASRTARANPYFAFIAMMMAGLDGIANKIDPGPPSDKDLYDLPPRGES